MHSNASMPVTNDSYMNQLLAIIDSRLQFISYKMKGFSDIDLASEAGSSRTDSFLFVQQTDLTFQIIERLTRQKSRLLTIRKHLHTSNVNIVFDLLQNDSYMSCSIKDIKHILLKIPKKTLDNQIPRASSAS